MVPFPPSWSLSQLITAALLETMSCRTLALRDYQQVLGQVTNTEEYSLGIQDLLLEIRALQKVSGLKNKRFSNFANTNISNPLMISLLCIL